MTGDLMKVFWMYRVNDESGVSGTGLVLEGFIFDDGVVVIKWVVEPFGMGIYKCYADFKKVHIDSHPTNLTRVEWRLVNQ